MNNFICNICEYSTKRQANYLRHTNSSKHLQKEQRFIHNKIRPTETHSKYTVSTQQNHSEKIYKCGYCAIIFSRADSLTRHRRTCTEKQDEITILKLKLKETEKENSKYKDECNYFKEESKYYKQLLRDAGTLVKTSVNTLTHVVDNYSNAPAIETISSEALLDLENNTKIVVEDILSAYKHNTLGKHL